MKEKVILTIDQSTSGTKAMFVNEKGKIVRKISKNHKQIYPREGWVEHDPIEIYENMKELLNRLSSYKEHYQVEVLSITNQRETIVVWDKNSGKPVYNAIVWQCRRTTKMCKELVDKGYNSLVHDKTGLKIDPYFSASKIKWIIDQNPGLKKKVQNGDILIGTIDSWLIWKLTNGQVHATDYTNASRTLLFNIYTLKWDKELLDLFDVPGVALPEVLNSNDIFGRVEDSEIPFQQLPISGVIGDSQGALFGQHCFEPGMSKATYGTGTSVLVFTEKPVQSQSGLVTSLAWGIEGKVYYAVEGIINSTGDTIKWLIEELKLIDHLSEAETLAKQIDNSEGVYFIPAFVGLGAPYWNPNVRAAVLGIGRNTGKPHIVRAALESIAYQVKDIIKLIEEESHVEIMELRVDGGATGNKFLMQFQSDILDKHVVASTTAELSALGSAYLAGFGIGLWYSLDEIKQLYRETIIYKSTMHEEDRKNIYQGWKQAVQRLNR